MEASPVAVAISAGNIPDIVVSTDNVPASSSEATVSPTQTTNTRASSAVEEVIESTEPQLILVSGAGIQGSLV